MIPLNQWFIEANDDVRVFCDAHPLETSPWAIRDYSGLRIFALTSLPLTQVCDFTRNAYPLASHSWESACEYRIWTFFLREDLYWEDGTHITGYDYQRGLNFLAKNQQHRFRSLLSDVFGFSKMQETSDLEGIRANNHSITFQLRNPNRLWPILMSFIGATPRHPHNPIADSGAYKVIQKNKNFLHLKYRDKFYSDTDNSIGDIFFDFQNSTSDPFSIKKWEQNIVDITWDTFFPYAKCELYNSHPMFHKSRPGILTFLSSQGCEFAPSADLIRFLYHTIDRERLVKELYNCPTPLYGYCHQTAPMLKAKPFIYKQLTLKIGYEPFFPNYEILAHLKDQLHNLGIFIEPIELKYGDRAKSLHLRLELLHNPIPDPFLTLRNELVQREFHDKDLAAWKRYARLFSLYQKCEDTFECQQLALDMDVILIEQGRIIPLLELPGFYLCNQSIDYHEYRPGRHWSWKNGEVVS